MANFFADITSLANAPASGTAPSVTRLKASKLGGRIRFFEATYQAPSSGSAPAIADIIYWGKLPLGARFVGHLSKLYWTTGTASCTLNLGDNVVPARHLAATAVTTAGGALCEASAYINSGTGNISNGSNVITNLVSRGSFQVGFGIVGTGIPLGAFITGVDRAARTCTISVPATATTAALAITTNGGGYEFVNDDNSVANGYASALDDATLRSTVAGAQIANNQVIVLKAAYVQD